MNLLNLFAGWQTCSPEQLAQEQHRRPFGLVAGTVVFVAYVHSFSFIWNKKIHPVFRALLLFGTTILFLVCLAAAYLYVVSSVLLCT